MLAVRVSQDQGGIHVAERDSATWLTSACPTEGPARAFTEKVMLLHISDVYAMTLIVLLGHRNGDITTHYSAPELQELLDAANRVCEQQSGKTPALVILKEKVVAA